MFSNVLMSKTLISLLILSVYGYYYYRKSIKRALSLIKLHIGEEEYDRFRQY
ncbi:hypothetical protein NSA47_07285 [Irregularibacter muris]|uniref:Uncharacterized protein n=1 Tax=Irregularibacter muris TaxID=1796619 RepID=A0AAE3KZ78_9FIRM|nr:hypothetical protein [Irregularibacter muris]